MAHIIPSASVEQDPVVLSYRPAPAPVPAPVAAEPPPLPQVAHVQAPRVEVPPQEDPRPSLEELRREAQERGYREGFETGERAAKEALAGEREAAAREAEALRTLCGSLREALGQGIEGLEDVMVEIAFAAACKVLGEAALTEEGLRSMVREAMRLVRNKEALVLRVSPADQERLGPVADEPGLKVVADDRVAAGGCMIETSGGTLDARLEVQLRQLLDTLTRARTAGAEQ